VRSSRLWAKLLGCENTVIEDVDWQEEDNGEGSGPALRLVVHVRAHKRLACRCGLCGQKRPRYDHGQGRRRWRALDLGTVRAYLEADAPRVSCPTGAGPFPQTGGADCARRRWSPTCRLPGTGPTGHLAHCLVNRVLVDNSTRPGVEAASGGRRGRVHGRRITLAAGAVGSPTILPAR
jgi:transposase